MNQGGIETGKTCQNNPQEMSHTRPKNWWSTSLTQQKVVFLCIFVVINVSLN